MSEVDAVTAVVVAEEPMVEVEMAAAMVAAVGVVPGMVAEGVSVEG